jgi:hypothetical protein
MLSIEKSKSKEKKGGKKVLTQEHAHFSQHFPDFQFESNPEAL